jgi:glycosyltransferase involved in cell wall biosynthesis
MYPLSNTDYISGIFVKEQVDALEKYFGVSFDIFNLQKYPSILRYTFAQLILLVKVATSNYKNIHIHYAISGLFLLFYKPKANVIITFHGSDILVGDGSWKKKMQTFLSKMLAKRADKIIVVSKEMIDSFSVSKDKISVIPCGINVDFFSENSKSVNASEDSFRYIIFPSNPERKEKNFSMFQDIINGVRKELPDLDIRVVYFKNKSREQIKEHLYTSDCLILISISEGSPQVIKEAMACQLPIVSVNVGDVKFVLDKVDEAYVFDHRNISDYIVAVVSILIRRPKSSNALNKLKEIQLDNYSIAKKVVELYV